MNKLTIEREKPDGKKKNQQSKGRIFSVDLLYYLKADVLWEGGLTNTINIRPVFIMLAGTESEMRSFLANFKGGRIAEMLDTEHRSNTGQRFQLLKSGNYQEINQRVDTGGAMGERYVVSTIYLVDLFSLDPGMIDQEKVGFISMPPTWWVEGELLRLTDKPELTEKILEHVRALGFSKPPAKSGNEITLTDEEIVRSIPQAAHFAAYLEKRTPRPFACELEFYVQLYINALKEHIACFTASASVPWTWARLEGNYIRDFDFLPESNRLLSPAVICQTNQAVLDEFLARQAKLYFTTQTEITARKLFGFTGGSIDNEQAEDFAVAS